MRSEAVLAVRRRAARCRPPGGRWGRAGAGAGGPWGGRAPGATRLARVDPHRPAVVEPGHDARAVALGRFGDAAFEPVGQVGQRHAPAEHLLGQRFGRRCLPRLAVGGEQRRAPVVESHLRDRLPQRRRQLELGARALDAQREAAARSLFAGPVARLGDGGGEAAGPQVGWPFARCGPGRRRRGRAPRQREHGRGRECGERAAHRVILNRASVSLSTLLPGSRADASRQTRCASSARPACQRASPRCAAISASGRSL